jgi:hypothetical protein
VDTPDPAILLGREKRFLHAIGGNEMTLCLVALCLLLTVVQSPAQGYYPLQTGNVWQYYETPPPGQYYGWTARATEDTLMPNGQQFRVIPTDLVTRDTGYLRQSGSKVYGWERIRFGGGAYEEVLLYDFSKRRGDTVVVRYSGGDTIYTLVADFYPINFYGRLLSTWIFVTETRPHPFQTVRQVMDSVGLVYIEYEGGMSYFMRGCIISGIQYGTITGVPSSSSPVPATVNLLQNYPNPFNPATRITYELPRAGMIRLSVFDVLGRQVGTLANERQEAGQRSVIFTGDDLPSGTYLYRLEADGMAQTRRMLLLK